MKTLQDNYIKYMRQFIDKPIMRLQPGEDGMCSFLEKIVYLKAIRSDQIKILTDKKGEFTISLVNNSSVFDELWVPIQTILSNPHPKYSNLEGKWVKRRADSADPSFTRQTFDVNCKYKLKKATATHLFFEEVDENGYHENMIIHTCRAVAEGWILDPEFN